MNRAENQQSGMSRGRGRGMCKNRKDNPDFLSNRGRESMGNLCRRTGESTWQIDQKIEAESVVGGQKRRYTSNLQMLKEQARRLTRALKNIETQIKSFEAEK